MALNRVIWTQKAYSLNSRSGRRTCGKPVTAGCTLEECPTNDNGRLSFFDTSGKGQWSHPWRWPCIPLAGREAPISRTDVYHNSWIVFITISGLYLSQLVYCICHNSWIVFVAISGLYLSQLVGCISRNSWIVFVTISGLYLSQFMDCICHN